MLKITPSQRAQIRAHSLVAEGTLRRYPHVSDASRVRIERAAHDLGIKLVVESTTAQKNTDSTPPSNAV